MDFVKCVRRLGAGLVAACVTWACASAPMGEDGPSSHLEQAATALMCSSPTQGGCWQAHDSSQSIVGFTPVGTGVTPKFVFADVKDRSLRTLRITADQSAS